MATAHKARVVRVDRFENGGSLLRLRMEEPLVFPHVAGQYVIVNSGMNYPTGKAGKRAYSIFAADAEKREFCLAAERVDDGLVSIYLNERVVGDELVFSGPWGKFQPPAEPWTQPVVGVAFETGITALLGLMVGHVLPTGSRLIWVRDPQAAFLPDNCVKDLLPAGLERLDIFDGSDADAAAAAAVAMTALADLLGLDPQVYGAGEGYSLDAFADLLSARGKDLMKESFFRRPLPLS